MKRTPVFYILAQILLGLFIILGILFLLTHDVRLFLSIIYSPYSFFLIVVIILEYIILKGMDRSRIYKLEIERLKRKRMKDRDFRQKLEKQVKKIQASIPESEEYGEIRKTLRDILNSLKEL